MSSAPTVPAARTAWTRIRAVLPEGQGLPAQSWAARHRLIVGVVAVHGVALAAFGIVKGWPLLWALGEGGLLLACAGLAALPRLRRRTRAAIAALGAVTSSAVLVQFSGGYIEAHFHFFIMVALVAMYEDWVPFLLAIAYVAVDHGVVGTLAPHWVYNHAAAMADPWAWAGIHAVAVLGECVALLAFWSASEASERRTKLILESASEGILGVDLQGRVTFANPAAAQILDRSEADLLDRGVPRLGGLGMAELVASADGAPHEARVLGADGRVLPIEYVVSAKLRNGIPIGYVIILRDIASRLQAEEARRRIEVLTEQGRFKTQLLNTASHELNTPIAAIRLQVKLLRKRLGSGDSSLHAAADTLDRNAQRLYGLVRDTMDVGRIETGKLQLRQAPTDLDALAREACASFGLQAAEAGVELACTSPRPVPVLADRDRMVQVLFNLLANALKFAPSGSRVEVRCLAEGATARLEVRDQGPGILPDEMGLLFKPFSQLPSHRDLHGQGTGLGLYISQGIAEAHGGRIWCQSEPGHGARFVLEVPLAPVAPAPGAPLDAGQAEQVAPRPASPPLEPAPVSVPG